MAVKYDGYLNVLIVADLARARDFYKDVMGLELVNSEDGVDAFFKVNWDDDGTKIEIIDWAG